MSAFGGKSLGDGLLGANLEFPNQEQERRVRGRGKRAPRGASRANAKNTTHARAPLDKTHGPSDRSQRENGGASTAHMTLSTPHGHEAKQIKKTSDVIETTAVSANPTFQADIALIAENIVEGAPDSYPQEGVPIDGDIDDNDSEAPAPLSKKAKKKVDKMARMVARDTGDVLQTIHADELTPVPYNVTWENDPELLCSYNWLDSEDGTNTIFVPGEPAKWMPPELPYTLPPDSGHTYSDYNYIRQPKNPYSPMFHALGVMNPNFQFNDVDILADRNNLRILLEFVQGKSNGPFRLDLYLALNTLILVRNGERFWKLADAGGSYGCNFEKTFTRPGVGMEDATNHYRAVRYPMGPLNVVVRFEADAQYDGESGEFTTIDDAIAVKGDKAERPRYSYNAPIRVVQKGNIVPNSQIAELKTKAYKIDKDRGVFCSDQLWFGRTSHLFTGKYEPGTGVIEAGMIKYKDTRKQVAAWEEKQQDNLRKLAGLLTRLRSIVRSDRGPIRAVVLVRDNANGPLVVRSKEEKYPIIKREFFSKHWELRPANRAPPQFGAPRGHSNMGRGGGYGRGFDPGRGGRGGYGRGSGPGRGRGGYGYAPRGS